jgi:hypothetical protein
MESSVELKINEVENIPVEIANELPKTKMELDEVIKQMKELKEFIKKNGKDEENIKKVKEFEKELKKHYYEEFKDKNTDKIHKKIECEICGGNYTYFNKSRHLKTPKCLNVKKLRNL